MMLTTPMQVVSPPARLRDETYPMHSAGVNRVSTVTTAGARLRAYMEARYIDLGLGRRHGFVVDMERRSGVKRATLNGWFQRSSAPRLDALGAVARVLELSRAELVAVFDGQEVIELDRARAMIREEIARASAPDAVRPEPTGGGAGTGAQRASGAAA